MVSNRKILYIAASPSWGGGEQYVCDLMIRLAEEGSDCFVVVPSGGAAADKFRAAVGSERVFTLPMR